MHPLLDKHLGRSLSASEVASFLRCNVATVYRNYKRLGGIRVGSTYRFFERSLIDALLGQTEGEVGRSGEVERQEVSIFSFEQVGCKKMGSAKTEKSGSSIIEDRHGLLV